MNSFNVDNIEQTPAPTTPGANLNLSHSLSHGARLTDKAGPRRSYERRFQLALFSFHKGDYHLALGDFEKVLQTTAQLEDRVQFIETCTYVLKILAEREEFKRIDAIEKQVLSLLETEKLTARLKSRTFYILGICACYQSDRHELAMARFKQSIDFAIETDDKEALATPLYGIATTHYAQGQFTEALRELDRLEVLLNCMSLPDLVSASHFLRAQIRRKQGRLDEALEAAWVAYETLKDHPHVVLYLHTLCALGAIYTEKGDTACARLYLDLVNRSLKRDEFPRIARLVDDLLGRIQSPQPGEMDLIFNSNTGVLIERVKGEIRFEGQFILRDLLRVFLAKPGRVMSKQELVGHVWHETYDAETHDNKIYVTIKRLRKLLESEHSKTEYILRAKSGYFLNPKAKVLVDDQVMQGEGKAHVTSK